MSRSTAPHLVPGLSGGRRWTTQQTASSWRSRAPIFIRSTGPGCPVRPETILCGRMSARGILTRLEDESEVPMLYAFLCYNNENAVMSWSKDEDDAVMDRLEVVHERLRKQ